MTTNKNDLNPILAGLRLEKSKEFEKSKELKDCKPFDGPAYLQKLAKEQPNLFVNTGSVTANALARDCIFQSKIYNLLNKK